MIKFFNLLIGGTIGTITRDALSGFLYKVFEISFPYGTLLVNMTRCFIIGFPMSLSECLAPTQSYRAL